MSWDFTNSMVTPPKDFEDCVALKGENFIYEIHQMIGFASTLMSNGQSFNTTQASGIVNELCLLARKYEEIKELYKNTDEGKLYFLLFK